MVAFHRPYKRLGVEKGDERRVERVDRKHRTVHLEGLDGSTVPWKPSEIGGRQGGTEVYRCESTELRAGDRIRWTRNDKSLGVVNSGLAEVLSIRNGRVTFRLEEGGKLTLTPGDPQLDHRIRENPVRLNSAQPWPRPRTRECPGFGRTPPPRTPG